VFYPEGRIRAGVCHFRGYRMETRDTHADKTHRIYIGPKPQHAVAVYKSLLDSEPPIVWSKLADHEILTTCRDALIVYVGSVDAFANELFPEATI
jgi:hypothetical protein